MRINMQTKNTRRYDVGIWYFEIPVRGSDVIRAITSSAAVVECTTVLRENSPAGAYYRHYIHNVYIYIVTPLVVSCIRRTRHPPLLPKCSMFYIGRDFHGDSIAFRCYGKTIRNMMCDYIDFNRKRRLLLFGRDRYIVTTKYCYIIVPRLCSRVVGGLPMHAVDSFNIANYITSKF